MIPLVRPELPELEEIVKFCKESVDVGKLTNFGPCYWALVERLCEFTGRYDVPCTNGTAAIQLIAQATFKRGSRILMPDFTHVGTLQGLVAAGMTPIMVPVSKASWTINAALITGTPLADFDGFVVVSPFGYRVDFKLYDQLARDLKKPVIYDLAGAFGMEIDTKNPVAFSMHATKNLPIGEGGIASFSQVHESSEAFQLSCFDQEKDRSIRSPYGNNLKLDEIRCAIALAQLQSQSKIMRRIERKRYLIDLYQSELGDLCIPHTHHIGNAAASLCVVSGVPASKLEERSKEMGFEVKKYYPLLSEMEGLQCVPRLYGSSSPFFRTCAALPSDVTTEEAKWIVKALRQELKAQGARGRRHPE